ncbi:hypothetical protein J8273_5341 [Carpediemonas membranifera]|uniref:Uncharacterized protein n=1 Tax=Carpediemonas membranifera TaxID=201153 RepID=A0A8J6E0W2_9EUKA|nr:hypothetical protein J8273_5341 [Carpediemonas membranifera]|eukprot:KAG9392351.1 hypothetical protein J8273_5341 [Carpediemonas membranifera]
MGIECRRTKAALIAVHRGSMAKTRAISGDIPSLIALAYQHHFGCCIPRRSEMLTAFTTYIHNLTAKYEQQTVKDIESLLSVINKVPPLKERAQTFLDRARSILTDGPPLSMNVELTEGEELPVALHTLNQGTLWACLLGGGANPDLEDRVLEEAQVKYPYQINIHIGIRQRFAPEAKCLWFLCRKFFFTANIAEKDGDTHQNVSHLSFYTHRMYMGRLFMFDPRYHAAFTRARMPRALEVDTCPVAFIARTPKGLWGWGDNSKMLLGVYTPSVGREHRFESPTRITFDKCPEVAELEASLQPWEKHRMVRDVSMTLWHTFILTPAGTVVAGEFSGVFYIPKGGYTSFYFQAVRVPDGFVPDHIVTHGKNTTVLSMGDRQAISGSNDHGQLGLNKGSFKPGLFGFEEISFSVDDVRLSGAGVNIFLSGGKLLFAGHVSEMIAKSGLLPGYNVGDKCLTPTPLRFPERVTSIAGDLNLWHLLAWTGEERTHVTSFDGTGVPSHYTIPFTVTAFETFPDSHAQFRDTSGRWFRVKGITDGVAKMEKATRASFNSVDLIAVDIACSTTQAKDRNDEMQRGNHFKGTRIPHMRQMT